MAEELRLALILLGALAIGSVILHGIWTVRRTVNAERKAAKKEAELEEPEIAPEEQEVQKLKLKQMEMDFATLAEAKQDGEGIPVVKVDVDSIYDSEQIETAARDEQTTQHSDDTNLLSHDHNTHNAQVESNETAADASQSGMFTNDDLEDNDDIPQFSTYDTEDDVDDVQFNVDSGDEPSAIDAPSITTHQDDDGALGLKSAEQNKTSSSAEPEKQEVLMLFVDKPEGLPIDGAKLLPTLLTLGFKYGDMELFHRHQNSSGQGEILFSLANMFNPGTFDIDQMEQLTTRGLTIFMTLPNAAEPLQTFNMMHNAAKKIADEFGATVLDDQRRPLDVAVVRAYVERIRKF